MSKKLLVVAAATLLGLAACAAPTPTPSSSTPAPGPSSSEPPAPSKFNGDIKDIEVGVDADITGFVMGKSKDGCIIADGYAAVYAYMPTGEYAVGDFVNAVGKDQAYYGIHELSKPTITVKETTRTIDEVVHSTPLTKEIVDAIDAKKPDGTGSLDYAPEEIVPYSWELECYSNADGFAAFKLADTTLELQPSKWTGDAFLAGVTYAIDNAYLVGRQSKKDYASFILGSVEAKYVALESLAVDASADVEISKTVELAVTATKGANPALTVSSSDEAVAKVKYAVSNGAPVLKVEGVAEGTATITYTSEADPTKTGTIEVHVGEPAEVLSSAKLTLDSFDAETGAYTGSDFTLFEVDPVSKASYNEVNFPKDKNAYLETTESVKGVREVILDVYGRYNNFEVYANGVKVTEAPAKTASATDPDNSFTYTYTLDYPAQVKILNPSSYDCAVYSIELKYNAEKAVEPSEITPAEEPAHVKASIADLLAKTAPETNVLYEVVGIWENGKGDKYGNGYLTDPDTGDSIIVYGATTTSTAITYDGSSGEPVYSYKNPQDAQSTLADLHNGDLVYMNALNIYFADKSLPEIFGVVTNIAESTDTYSVVVDSEIVGGTVVASKTADVAYGEDIVLTVTPDAGKKVAKVSVEDAFGKKTDIVAVEGVYSFKATCVNKVTAEFEDADAVVTSSTITADKLGVTGSYGNSSSAVVIDGASWEFNELTKNSADAIQMRVKDGKTSVFFNSTAFEKAIKSVTVTFDDAQSATKDLLFVAFGAEKQDAATEGTKVTFDGTEKVYTVSPAEGVAPTFVAIKHSSTSGAVYLASVVIEFVD